MDLKELYTLETGQDVAPKAILGVGASFSNGYVEWLENRLRLYDVSQRLMVGSKVCFIAHKNITGVIVDRSDIGFNHWMVKWDRTGETVREYGNDLVVC